MKLLEEIAEVTSGQGAPQGDKFFSEEGVPFVRAGSLENLLNGGKLIDLEKINHEVGRKEGLRLFPKNSVLFAKSGMSATKDRVFVLPDEAFVVSHLAVIIPKENLSERFFKYWMSSFKPSSLIRDRAYPSIRLEDISRIKFPDLKIEEQEKIAGILEHADAARQKRKQANHLTEQFLQSAFLEMFGDPVRNEKGWEKTQLDKICKRITDGTHQPPEWSDEGIPFIFVSNIRSGEISLSTNKFITERSYIELTRRCPIELGDILFTIVGSYGNAAVVKTKEKFSFQRHIAHLKPDFNKVVPTFLVTALESPFMKSQIEKSVKGVAQKTLNLSELKYLETIFPPLPLQQKFASLAEQVEQLRNKQRASEKELENLFGSLMQRYFG